MGSRPWRTEKTYRSREDLQPVIATIESELPDVEWHPLGSWRRGSAQVGDLDILLITRSGKLPRKIPSIINVEHMGDRLLNGNLEDGFHIDLYSCKPKERGAMLWFMTGPMPLNIAMRADAKRVGLKLNQYGVFKGLKQLDDGTEKDIAEILDLHLKKDKYTKWLDPRQREKWAKPKEGKAEEIEVQGSGGAKYIVRVEGPRLSCTCPGYQFRGECKHINALRESQ